MKHPLFTVITRQIFLLLLTCSLAAAASQPELQKIRHTVLSPTSEQVALQFNGSYSPKIFTLKDETPRIIFDFPEMTYGREIQATTLTKGSMVKRIRVGKHTGETSKTRIVFDMATLTGVTYTQKFDDKSSALVIEFTSPKPAAPGTKSTPAAATDVSPSKAKSAAKKIDEKKGLAPETAQVLPETTGDAQTTAKTETTPPASAAESSPATSEQTSRQPVAPAEKTEEKTPAAMAAPSQPEATAAAKTEPTQVESTAPAPPQTSPKQTITVVKAEEKTMPTPAPTPPDTVAKTPAKTEPTPTESIVTTPPAPAVPTPKPADAVAKTEEKTTPAPTPPPPDTTTKTPAKAEPAPTESTVTTPPTPAVPSPKPADAMDKAEEKTTPTPVPPPPDTAAKTPTKMEAAKPAVTAGGGGGPLLESVRFDGTSPKGEMVLFKLNDFHPPVIHGVEEGVPRVICDFNGMQLADSVKNQIKADGKYVKIIRVTKSKKPDRVRVVLDLAPNRSYDLQQVFFKEDNLFVIIVNLTKK